MALPCRSGSSRLVARHALASLLRAESPRKATAMPDAVGLFAHARHRAARGGLAAPHTHGHAAAWLSFAQPCSFRCASTLRTAEKHDSTVQYPGRASVASPRPSSTVQSAAVQARSVSTVAPRSDTGHDSRLRPGATPLRTRAFAVLRTSVVLLLNPFGTVFAGPGRRFGHRPYGPSSTSSTSSSSPGSGALSRLLRALMRRLNRLPPGVVMWTIVGLNALVFFAWSYGNGVWQRFGDPTTLLFLSRNFLNSSRNLAEGRWWTLITSAFSHEDKWHFALNMMSFSFTAVHVLGAIGNSAFLGLYLGAGIVSATVSLAKTELVEPWLARNGWGGKRAVGSPEIRASHGASGSVYAVLATFACMSPKTTFLLFFVVPMPAWLCVSGLFAWDLSQAWLSPGARVDSAGHIGGMLAGVLFWRYKLGGMRVHI